MYWCRVLKSVHKIKYHVFNRTKNIIWLEQIAATINETEHLKEAVTIRTL